MRRFLLFISFLAVSLGARAQLFLSGGITLSYAGTSTELVADNTYSITEKSGFTLGPAVGYMFPGKRYGVGLLTGYAHVSELGDSNKVLSNGIDIAPFFRYVYAVFPKITLYADLKLPIGYSKKKTVIDDHVTYLGETSLFGVRIVPGLSYKFTDHILFTTEIGLMRVDFVHTKTISYSNHDVIRNNDFTLGANNRAIASFCFVYLF